MVTDSPGSRGPYNPDRSLLSSLREAINESGKRLHATLIWYLAITSYFILTISGTKPEQILVGGNISVPALNITMPMEMFCFVGPVAVVLLHVYVLIQMSSLINLYPAFHQELRFASEKEQAVQRSLFLPSLLTYAMLGPKRSALMRAFAMLILAGLCLLLPLFGLLYCQIHFLPYHSEFLTNTHRWLVTVDGLLAGTLTVWSLYRTSSISASDTKQSLRLTRWSNLITYACLMALVSGPIYVSVAKARIPDPLANYDINFLDSINNKSLRNLTLPQGLKVLTAAGADRTIDLSKRDLRGADLRGVDFTGVNLEGAQLQNAMLAGAKFITANLRSADLEGATARSTQFDGADLSFAKLAGVYAAGADFSGANTSGADFEFAWLEGADFNAANIGGNFRGAFADKARFCGAIFGFADFTGASLRAADFCSSGMALQQFPEFDRDVHAPRRLLHNTNNTRPELSFARADLTNARLDGVDLEFADFTGTDLTGVHIAAPTREALEEVGKQIYRTILDGRSKMVADLRLKYAGERMSARLPASFPVPSSALNLNSADPSTNWNQTASEFLNLMCRNQPLRTDFIRGVELLPSSGTMNERFKAISGTILTLLLNRTDCKFDSSEITQLRSIQSLQVSSLE